MTHLRDFLVQMVKWPSGTTQARFGNVLMMMPGQERTILVIILRQRCLILRQTKSLTLARQRPPMMPQQKHMLIRLWLLLRITLAQAVQQQERFTQQMEMLVLITQTE